MELALLTFKMLAIAISFNYLLNNINYFLSEIFKNRATLKPLYYLILIAKLIY